MNRPGFMHIPPIITLIDSFYNPYIKIYNNVLFDIYNPNKKVYNSIIDELSNKKKLSLKRSKNKYIKIKEYSNILGTNSIICIDALRTINGAIQLISNQKTLNIKTQKTYNHHNTNWVIVREYIV